jgi:hemerythrin superfamily protein
MLETAGSTVGKVLRGSTDTVKEVGAGLVNTAREVITSALAAGHDAVSVLKGQHREVEELFRKVLETHEVRARRELLHEIASALAMHTKIEEDIFYPAVRSLGTEEATALIDEALEEHHVVDLVLNELPRVSPRDDRFDAKMTVLSEIVDHHVKEEERDMFKRAQALGRERLEELGARLEAAAARGRGAAGRSRERGE